MKTMDDELGALLRAAADGDPIGAVDTDRVVGRGRRGVRRRRALAAGGSALAVAGVAGSLVAAQGLLAADPAPAPPAASTSVAPSTSAAPKPQTVAPVSPATPTLDAATAARMTATMRAILIDRLDPRREHLRFTGLEFRMNGLGGFRTYGGRVAWRIPGQKGEGYVSLGIAERAGAIHVCGDDEFVKSCRKRTLPNGRTVEIGRNGEAVTVYYHRPDGTVTTADVRPLFANNTSIPLHDIAITEQQLFALVQDPRLRLPAASEQEREQAAKLTGFKPTFGQLRQAATRHLTGGTLTQGYSENVPEEIGANYDWRGNGVKQEVFLAVYAGTVSQSCGPVSRSACERVVAPNGKVVLYGQSSSKGTVSRTAVHLQPDGNWVVASVRVRPGEVDKGITKEQLVALAADRTLDR